MTGRHQDNERVVRSLFRDVINGNEYDQIPELCSEEICVYLPGERTVSGIDGYERHYRELHATIQNFDASCADVVVGSERVAVRFSVTGTHERELLGIPPTGRRVNFQAQILFHVDDGVITREHHQSDYATLRRQLTSSENDHD